MGKANKGRNAKRKQQARNNKARSHWAGIGNPKRNPNWDTPLFKALLAGCEGTFSEDSLTNAPQMSGVVSSYGHEYAFIYGKNYSIPNRDFIGKTYEHEGKFYLASWTELLHPSTARGGLWVVREYDHLPSEKEFNGFLLCVMTLVVPHLETTEAWFFEPIVNYNMRLLGMDTLPDDYFTPERFFAGLTDLIGDMKTDDGETSRTHHV